MVVMLVGLVFFVLTFVLMGIWGRRAVRGLSPTLEPKFPSPKA